MEVFLLIGLFLVYIVSSFFVCKNTQQKIWTMAFIVTFLLTGFTLLVLKIQKNEIMLTSGEFNWFYLLYLFGSIAGILGLINIWMYRQALIGVFFSKPDCELENPAADDTDNL